MIVTINGCFDILHVGHLDLIEYAKTKGTKLIILLNSDESIKKLKGKNRPINNYKNRKRFLLSIKGIDKIIKFNTEKELHKKLKKIQPKYHIKSKDAKKELAVLEEEAIKPNGKILWFKNKNNYSSTKIIEEFK